MRTFKSPYVVGRGASLLFEQAPQDEVRFEFQKVAESTHKLIGDVMADLALFYEKTYNICALRPGPVFVCQCELGFHEAVPYTNCWYKFASEYGESLVEEYWYEKDTLEDSEYKDMTDEQLSEMSADIVYDADTAQVRENDIGWFWQWGNWYYNIWETDEMPLRQLIEQLQRIKMGRRPQLHESFDDGNTVPYVKPPKRLQENAMRLTDAISRHDQIRDIVNRKLYKHSQIRPLVDTEDWKNSDRVYDRVNPLNKNRRLAFDGYPHSYYENADWGQVAEHEVLAFLQSGTTPQTWKKFERWYSDRNNIAKYVFKAANDLFKIAKGQEEWFLKQRPKLATHYQHDQYWSSPVGQSFKEFIKQERPYDRPIVAAPVCEVFIQDGPDAGKRLSELK